MENGHPGRGDGSGRESPGETTAAASRQRSEGIASLLRGTAGSCINKALANGQMFVVQVIFARMLGLEGFGFYAIALAWISVLVMVGRLGFDLATVRYVAMYQGSSAWALLRGFLSVGRSAALTASATAGGALILVAVWLRTDIGNALADALIVAALVIPVLALVQIEASALRGLGRVVIGDLPLSIAHPLLLLGGFLCAVTWWGAPANAATALASYLAASLLVLAVLHAMLHREMPAEAMRTEPCRRWREWLASAPAMMLTAGFGVVLNQSSTIVVGAFAGAEEAGIYGAAARISAILQIIVFSLATAIGPLAARLSAAGEQRQLQRALDVGVAAVFAAALIAALGVAVLGRWLLGLFGADFVAGYEIVLILAGGQICAAAAAPAGILLNMTGHHSVSAWILAAAAAINLVLCIALTAGFGPAGAATATALTIAGLHVAMAVLVHRRLGLRSWISPLGLQFRAVRP